MPDHRSRLNYEILEDQPAAAASCMAQAQARLLGVEKLRHHVNVLAGF
jgi:hypothetical protein